MKRQSTESSEKIKRKKIKKCLSKNNLKEISVIFLSDKKHANLIIDLLDQFRKPKETSTTCVSTVEHIFVKVLERMDMTVKDTENLSEAEKQYKEWLSDCYQDVWDKLGLCLQKGTPECKLQSLNSMFKLLSTESKFPLSKGKKKKRNQTNFPINRLKHILKSLSLSSTINADILKRLSEFTEYRDLNSNIWLALDSLLKNTSKIQLVENSIGNILLILSALPKSKKMSEIVFCNIKNGVPEERTVKTAVSNVWQHLSRTQYSSNIHQLLLVVLVEQIMPKMENAIFLTDYLMDSLDRSECEISMLALQGIYNLVIRHNIEYPNIFKKLYQLFTEDTLRAKYKTRLFVLADEFLRSTHLPLALVAAFVKRFSRLLLVATPPDMLILLSLIGNLLIRHPGLETMYHNRNAKEVDDDPYIEDEQDPLKSRALGSQMWEVQLMQHHYTAKVAKMVKFINNDLPSIEYQLDPLLELTWEKMIRIELKQLTKKIPKVAEKFEDKALSNKMAEAKQKELMLLLSDLNKMFTFT